MRGYLRYTGWVLHGIIKVLTDVGVLDFSDPVGQSDTRVGAVESIPNIQTW